MCFIAKTRSYSDDITIIVKIEEQPPDGVNPADVKISLRLTRILKSCMQNGYTSFMNIWGRDRKW